MRLWRVSTRDRFDGEGARRFGARWNRPGTPVIYMAATLALAILETLAYARERDVRRRLFAHYVDVPDDSVRQALLGFGLDEWFAGALVGLYQDYRRSGAAGYAARVSDTVERLTGRPARSLDQLLDELKPHR